MSKPLRTVQLDCELVDEAEKVAEREGLDLDIRLDRVISERLTTIRSETYLAARRSRADLAAARKILSKAGSDTALRDGDEIV